LGPYIESERIPITTFSFSKLKKEIHEYSSYDFYEPSLDKIRLPPEAREMTYLLEPLVIPKPYYFIEQKAKLFGSIPLVLDRNYELILETLPQSPPSPSEFYKQINSSLFLKKKLFKNWQKPKRTNKTNSRNTISLCSSWCWSEQFDFL
jgi:hypothetical protein